MKRSNLVNAGLRTLVLVATGLTMLGNGCAYDIRNSLVAGSLDFVEGSAGDVLDAILPIGDILAGLNGE